MSLVPFYDPCEAALRNCDLTEARAPDADFSNSQLDEVNFTGSVDVSSLRHIFQARSWLGASSRAASLRRRNLRNEMLCRLKSLENLKVFACFLTFAGYFKALDP